MTTEPTTDLARKRPATVVYTHPQPRSRQVAPGDVRTGRFLSFVLVVFLAMGFAGYLLSAL